MSEPTKNSRTATIAFWLGIAGPALLILGIAIAQLGAPPMSGFLFLPIALLAGLLALLTGIAGLILTRGGVGGRQRAALGTGLGVLMVLVFLVSTAPGRGVPSINDITTDLDDPPAFAEAAPGHRNAGRDMSYPPDFVEQVRDAYGDLGPIRLSLPRDEAYRVALAGAEGLGWEITRRDPAAGVFEAQDTTALFRFVDDVSVRVRAEGETKSVIDVRSKSRDGQGDVGANAARIRLYTGRIFDDVSSGVAAAPER